MNPRINNRQRRHRVDPSAVSGLARLLFLRASRRCPDVDWSAVTLYLTDDNGIAAVKEAAFGRREATDVVALSYASSPADPGAEGEVFVNVQRAFACPRRRGWSPARELALYIAHGMDHLSGADDGTESERLRMRRRELRWIGATECAALIARLDTDKPFGQ